MTTKSSSRDQAEGPPWPRPGAAVVGSGPPALGAPPAPGLVRLVDVPVDVARDLAREAGHRLELLAARGQEALRASRSGSAAAACAPAPRRAGRRGSSASSPCRGGRGGTRSRSGGPRRGRAGAGGAPGMSGGEHERRRGRPGRKTSSIRLARETTTTPRSRNSAQRVEPGRELALAAVDDDQPRQRRRSSRRRRCSCGERSRWCHVLGHPPARAPRSSPRSRPARPPGCRSGGSPTSSARRPRTPPSRRRCGSRPGSRCRSTRSASGSSSMPSAAWSPSSASIRCERRCSERSRSWSRARRALRCGQLEDAALVPALGVADLDAPRRGARPAPRRASARRSIVARDDHLRREWPATSRSTGARTPRPPRPRRGPPAFSR